MAPTLVQFLLLLLIATASCQSQRQHQRTTPVWRTESYSIHGGQVKGRQLALYSYPLRSYTHYFSTADMTPRYTFTVHVGGGPHQNGTGMFVSLWELGQEFKIRESTVRDRRRRRRGAEEKAGEKKGKICERYTIRLSYPEDEDKPPRYVCDQNGNTPNLTDLVALEDYEGRGTVQVDITNRGIQDLISMNPELNSAFGTNYWGDDADQNRYWTSKSGRKIPPSSIGGLTFTLYRDCTKMSTENGSQLRPCSSVHNTTCIASALFCNGELNCVTSFWEYILQAKYNPNATAEFEEETSPSFDESNFTCGGSGHLQWERTTITRTYTYSKTGGGGGGGMGIVFGVVASVIFALCGIVAKAAKLNGGGGDGARANAREQQMPLRGRV